MKSILYPTFEIIENKGILPHIHLPRNFKELVPKFYQEKIKEILEDYAGNLENFLKETPFNSSIKLQWNKKNGLTNINVGSAGLDLSQIGIPKFVEHNLGTYNAIPAGIIAMKYVSELLKSGED